MAYVEWLRVRGCLRWCGIVLGILFLIGVVFRIAIIGLEHDVVGLAANMRSDPGAKVAETTLPDGTHRVVIDDPVKQAHVIIDDRGALGKHIEILDRSRSGRFNDISGSMQSMRVKTLPHNGGTLTVAETGGSTTFSAFVIHGLILALIVATVLGAPFARENDGHLEISLTKPVARETLALQTFGADVVGIVASFVGGLVFAIAIRALFELPHITVSSFDLLALGIAIVAPIAWYAMLAAATASIKRGYGAILGFAWPVAVIVVLLSLIPPNGNGLETLIHGVAWLLSWIDPLTYMHFGSHHVVTVVGQPSLVYYNGWYQVAALVVLVAIYAMLAIIQWRRVEA
jgi:hypothetical protein